MLSNLVPQRAAGGAVIRFFGGAAKTARLSGRAVGFAGGGPSGFAGGAQHLLALVHVKSLQLVACRAEVFAGIEFRGLVHEDFANGGSHRQTAVGVDVDFAYGRSCGSTQLFFGDTYGVF